MKVVLDLPDWVDERNIRILAGIELVAEKASHEDHWKVKEGRCNMCGDCCNAKTHKYPIINGFCIYLEAEDGRGRRMCGIALDRSRGCERDPLAGKYERCSITYKKVKQE